MPVRRPVALRYGLTVLAALLATGLALAVPFASPKGYRVTPPPGWKTSPGIMGLDVIFRAAPRSGFAANATVVTTPAPHGQGSDAAILRQVAAGVNARYPQMFTHYKRLSQGMMTVQGAQALQTTGTYLIGTPARAARVRQVYAMQGGAFHIFTLTTLAGAAAPYDAQFTAMLRSVRWTH